MDELFIIWNKTLIMKKDILIILDSFEYKQRERELFMQLEDIVNPHFFYSKYENRLTELFQRTKIVGGLLTHITYWIMSLGYAFRLLSSKYSKNSLIIFINPIVGIFYCMLSRFLFFRKNIAIGGFLFEIKKNKAYLLARKAFVNFCYKKVEHIFVYGENEVEHYNLLFPKLKGKFEYVKYGRDFIYKDKKDFHVSGPYIASGGRSNRKYETLCSAMKVLNSNNIDIECLIATRPECVTSDMEHSPVKFQYGITLNQFGSFIEHSTIFVLPLLNTQLSAGHMAMMEAMANEKPIIVTDIPAIRDYVSENHVTFYKPDDSEDLASKISFVLNNIRSEQILDKVKQAKLLYENEYSFKALLRRIVLKTTD